MGFHIVRSSFLMCCVAMLLGMTRNTSQKRPGSDIHLPSNDECHSHEMSKRSARGFLPNKQGGPQGSIKANTSCSTPRLSCRARKSCSDPLHATANEFTCYCDSYCESFLDCCYDFSSACNRTARNDNLTETKDDVLLSWSCVKMGEAYYWMKKNCSKSWQNNEVASLCVDPPLHLNSSTCMDFLPVFGADNDTYRNRHCAQCNYQNIYEFWMLNITLSFEPVGIGSIEDLIDFVVDLKGDEFIDAVVPKLGMVRRYCRKPISNCFLTELTSEEIVNDCVNGDVALLYAGVEKFYKNKNCALCNSEKNVSCKGPDGSKDVWLVSDFYLTINFKHKSQSRGYSVAHSCGLPKIYDHYLKSCLHAQDIVPPIDAPLDKYRIAVWFLWPYLTCNMPNTTHFCNSLTDVKPSDVFNGKFQEVQNKIHMIRLDVQLTLNQSFELLENSSKVEGNSTTGTYSILKFIKPFIGRFSLRLGSKTVKVIKTSSRQLGCVGLQVFKPSDYTYIDTHGKIYVNKTNRNYTREQYFKDDSSNGSIKICEKQLPNDCDGFYLEYSRSEFEVRNNLSLYHKLRGALYSFGQYTVHNDVVSICHKTLPDNSNRTRRYLTSVGLSLSTACLIMVLMTYTLFSKLRTAPGKNIVNLTIALVLFDVIWLASPPAVQYRPACIAIAFGKQYFMLVTHVNMAKIARDTLCMFTDPIAHQRKGSTHLKTFIKFWIIPLVFVSLSFTSWHLNILDVQCTKNCWLSGDHVFAIVYIPVCLTMTFNILCFTRSISKMRQLEQNGQMLRAQKQEKSSVLIYIKISTIVGLGWASAFIAVPVPEFSYVFIALTTFQGVYIFLAFVCTESVLTLYRNLVCGKREIPSDRRKIETNVLKNINAHI